MAPAESKKGTAYGWHFMVLMSRQGKIRLSEFFSSYSDTEKRRIQRDIAADVLPRQPKMCNIIEKGTYKFVYRRYASLYFVAGVPLEMNELIVLEQIQRNSRNKVQGCITSVNKLIQIGRAHV